MTDALESEGAGKNAISAALPLATAIWLPRGRSPVVPTMLTMTPRPAATMLR